MTDLVWVTRNDGKTNNPAVEGVYAVMVSGDSEYCDGHLIYAFDDYQSWATFSLDEDLGLFKGDQDEEDDTIFAYYGPINIPTYEAP